MKEEITWLRCVLHALLASEQNTAFFNDYPVSSEVLGLPTWKIDRLVWKLAQAGFVGGIWVYEDPDDGEYPLVNWERCRPVVTMDGLLWLRDEEERDKEVA